MVDDRVVGGLPVIGAIGGEPSDWTIDLIEKWAHLRGVASILVGHYVGDDLATIGIQCQMQLAPTATGPGAMFLLQPLARDRS